MPIPTPIITAGAALLGQAGNAAAQSAANKKSRKWQEHMYKWQRADALADRDYQNQYDSPAAQMARFRAAGLNPNLIYGQMSESASTRSSDSGSWSPKAPEFDAGSVIGAYQNAKMQQAQMDMLSKQNALIDYEMELKRQQALNTQQSTANMATDNAYLTGTMKERISMAAADLQYKQGSITKQAEDTLYTRQSNQRAQELHPGNLANQILQQAETSARTSNIREQTTASRQNRSWQNIHGEQQSRINVEQAIQIRRNIQNMEKDGTLKEYEIKLNQKGVQKNDPLYMRWIAESAEALKKPGAGKAVLEQTWKNIFGIH